MKNSVVNPFRRFLHFALGIQDSPPVKYIMTIQFKPVPAGIRVTKEAVAVSSVSINLSSINVWRI